MTVKSSASAGATRCHITCVCGKPCSSRSGAPLPLRRMKIAASPTSTSDDSKPANSTTSAELDGSRDPVDGAHLARRDAAPPAGQPHAGIEHERCHDPARGVDLDVLQPAGDAAALAHRKTEQDLAAAQMRVRGPRQTGHVVLQVYGPVLVEIGALLQLLAREA